MKRILIAAMIIVAFSCKKETEEKSLYFPPSGDSYWQTDTPDNYLVPMKYQDDIWKYLIRVIE